MKEIYEKLVSLSDEGYKKFHSALIPDIPPERIIGVRVPLLRSMAKEISVTPEAEAFLSELPHEYYEENNLHAFLLERIKNYDLLIAELERFLPYIDNWATCDGLRPKALGRYPHKTAEKALGWMKSDHTYTVRYGIGTLMNFFLGEYYAPEYPEAVVAVKSNEYYINMMRAWYFATALIGHYDELPHHPREEGTSENTSKVNIKMPPFSGGIFDKSGGLFCYIHHSKAHGELYCELI